MLLTLIIRFYCKVLILILILTGEEADANRGWSRSHSTTIAEGSQSATARMSPPQVGNVLVKLSNVNKGEK